ncbi:MAG TPA: HD domain-containing phosphohydrolase [Candidatus Baltobacteraceae bacterium]|jgi:putative nucleotidyltransferase with HDIG domain|nr:HD domain-containing phosphohydrolase [Candidatus Baltobacteraceae bacterium]
MHGRTGPYGSGCRPIARTIEKRRSALKRTVIAHLSDGTYAPPVDAVLEEFIGRVAEAFARDSWDELLQWVDRTCCARAQSRSMHRLFTTAPAVLSNEFCDFDEAPFPYLARFASSGKRIAAIARERCGGRIAAMHAPVDALDVLLADLLNELYAVDRPAGEHSRAVSGWCRQIAARIELPQDLVLRTTRGGLVHDIGRITTPRELLAAARPLNEYERQIVREHVHEGEAILRHSVCLSEFVPFIRHHHERYDGTGYPQGLSGDSIPLTVRVVTVADAFNAMITPKPYRAAMAQDQALEELQRCKSTQFDPFIVDALVEVVQGHSAAPEVTALAP